jgi:hypothetical protein
MCIIYTFLLWIIWLSIIYNQRLPWACITRLTTLGEHYIQPEAPTSMYHSSDNPGWALYTTRGSQEHVSLVWQPWVSIIYNQRLPWACITRLTTLGEHYIQPDAPKSMYHSSDNPGWALYTTRGSEEHASLIWFRWTMKQSENDYCLAKNITI